MIVFFVICALWHRSVLQVEDNIRLVEEDVDRINTYFNGTLQVYRIPPWVEVAPVKTKVIKIQNLNYVLQTEEFAEKTKNNPYAVAGMPYYPFASKGEALRVFNKLTIDENPGYIIVSNSIIYIGHADEKEKELIQAAADYFDSQ